MYSQAMALVVAFVLSVIPHLGLAEELVLENVRYRDGGWLDGRLEVDLAARSVSNIDVILSGAPDCGHVAVAYRDANASGAMKLIDLGNRQAVAIDITHTGSPSRKLEMK